MLFRNLRCLHISPCITSFSAGGFEIFNSKLQFLQTCVFLGAVVSVCGFGALDCAWRRSVLVTINSCISSKRFFPLTIEAQ